MVPALLALALAPAAPAAADFCSPPPALERRVPVPDNVNFFLRSSPALQQVGMATSAGNRILDVKTGEFREAPGLIDPVLSPDGAILTTPETWVWNPKTKQLLTEDQAARLHLPGHKAFGVRFQLLAGVATEWDDVRKGKAHRTSLTEEQLKEKGVPYAAQYMSFYRRESGEWKLLAQDKDSQVVYQSVGVLGQSKDGTVYRLLVEGDDGLYERDYELSKEGLRFGQPAHAVCGGIYGTLPVLDKTGTEFSTYQPQSAATKVIGIGEKGDLCETRETIPLLLGKADFSPAGRRLAFHVYGSGKVAKESTSGLRVYVFDRDSHALVPVPGPAKEDSYYPVFLDDDRIAFLSATAPAGRGKQQFHVNVASLKGLPLARCPGCYDGAKREGQLAALLGAIRLRSCHGGKKPSFPDAMLSFGLLTRESCAALVKSCGKSCPKGAPAPSNAKSGWDGGRAHEAWDNALLGAVSAADLTEACSRL